MRLEKDEPYNSGTGAGTDPSALPLFGAAAPVRRGRVRGGFSLTDQGSSPRPPIQPGPVHQSPTVTGNGSGPQAVTTPGARTGSRWAARDGMDWQLVAALRSRAAAQLAKESTDNLARDTVRDRGRSIILELVAQESNERARAGLDPFTPGEQGAVAAAVFDAVFGLGRLQPLIDDEEIENIQGFGHERVLVELAGGLQVTGPRLADSQTELIEFLTFIAGQQGGGNRPFSPANPTLHLRLDSGARMVATAWVSPVPYVAIRRHRLTDISLPDLVDRGSLTPLAASFLAAAVRANKRIIVAGQMNSGKTTLVRALCNEIPPDQTIGTFETEFELHLHQMPHKHPRCFAFETRPGSGEIGPDGRRAGEYTLAQLLKDSFRYTIDRQIVGEVKAPDEIEAMIDAMQSGAGSISTTHANDAKGALGKLVTSFTRAPSRPSYDAAAGTLGHYVDLVVFVAKDITPEGQGQRLHRYVSEIVAVEPGESGYSADHVFRTRVGGGRVCYPVALPDWLRGLDVFGFDESAFLDQAPAPGERP